MTIDGNYIVKNIKNFGIQKQDIVNFVLKETIKIKNVYNVLLTEKTLKITI